MSDTPTALRITVRRGMIAHKFVLTEPPYPKIGDSVTLNGAEWFVSAVKPTKLLARVPLAKAKVLA